MTEQELAAELKKSILENIEVTQQALTKLFTPPVAGSFSVNFNSARITNIKAEDKVSALSNYFLDVINMPMGKNALIKIIFAIYNQDAMPGNIGQIILMSYSRGLLLEAINMGSRITLIRLVIICHRIKLRFQKPNSKRS
jgi:hypothetical protein